jgi:hypothetical protein
MLNDVDHDRTATAIHEAAHVIASLVDRSKIKEVSIEDNGRGGLMKRKREQLRPIPAPESASAITLCSIDFIGAIAVQMAYRYELPKTDEDFARLGAGVDIEHFKGRAAIVTNLDEKKTATLRARAIELAIATCEAYGDAIFALAFELRLCRKLDHAGVVRVLCEKVPRDARELLGASVVSDYQERQRPFRCSRGEVRPIAGGRYLAVRPDGTGCEFRSFYAAYCAL